MNRSLVEQVQEQALGALERIGGMPNPEHLGMSQDAAFALLRDRIRDLLTQMGADTEDPAAWLGVITGAQIALSSADSMAGTLRGEESQGRRLTMVIRTLTALFATQVAAAGFVLTSDLPDVSNVAEPERPEKAA